MGLFRGIKNNYKKSEAAVVVQNLLEIQVRSVLFEDDPGKSANTLVGAVWDKTPHLFDGRFGQRPHKLSVAASAFSNAITVLAAGNPNRHVFMTCLGNIFNELETNGSLYPLNRLDEELLNVAAQVLSQSIEEFEASPLGKEVSALTGRAELVWEDWYQAYKDEAGLHDPALASKPNGLCLIDLMDDEPLRRAFRDGVEPRGLARRFAEQFDITEFGS